MRRLYLAASGLGLSVAVSLAMANGPETEYGTPVPTVEVERVAIDRAAEGPDKLSDPEAVLREEYLRLMQEKAALMDKASLEAALSAAQHDIQELEADKLLDEAKAILARVSQEYPQTKAANVANVLMRQSESLDAPTYYAPSSESYKPL